jgi:hypothetical protein
LAQVEHQVAVVALTALILCSAQSHQLVVDLAVVTICHRLTVVDAGGVALVTAKMVRQVTANQGFAGGNGAADLNSTAGGGGGGASAVGNNGVNGSSGDASSPGDGGNGLAVAITGSSVTYAGGGGAGSQFSSVSGTGDGGTGLAGDGYKGVATPATSGAVNTGSGGGGAGGNNASGGGQGGSGFVVIRYADTFALATATTGSPTQTTTGGFHIYEFTASGSITF